MTANTANTNTWGVSGRRLHNVDLLESIDAAREAFFGEIDVERRSTLGQFGTPTPVARLMASMFGEFASEIRLLDAGAGVGSLSAAFVAEACSREQRPDSIAVTACEVEPALLESLTTTLEQCGKHCHQAGIAFSFELITEDFIEAMAKAQGDLFSCDAISYTHAIQNPPYKKIRSDSQHRALLRGLGIEVSNLYAAFVALTVRVLEPDGELVAITPRSFCNGPYFNKFRADFLSRMALRRIHVFESRSKAFGGDSVLQENVIVHAAATRARPETVNITGSTGEPGDPETTIDVPYDAVVPDTERNPAIYIVADGMSQGVAERMAGFTSSLDAAGLAVSTGRVVDFRAREFLRMTPSPGDAPLIYPLHLREGAIRWPVDGAKKPNGLAMQAETRALVCPAGTYVLVKRFSSKEQRRRIEAAIYDSSQVHDGPVGFENHLNYIHRNGRGLERDAARGLFLYLNSSLVDMYFRLFSGHTQVNATDLRNLPFPDIRLLRQLGQRVERLDLSQDEIDALFDEALLHVNPDMTSKDPVAANKKVEEARALLKELGFPKAQSNLRSALVLLALLDIKQDDAWSAAQSPQLGITEIMDWFAGEYGKKYAPNSRETVRRQTVHQFLDAGLLVRNPDDPGRPVNSGKNVYQVVPEALTAVRLFGTPEWAEARDEYASKATVLKEAYAQPRKLERIPLQVADDIEISLSPGGQNVLVEKIITEFAPRFAPGAKLVYVGDAEEKWAYFDKQAFSSIGLEFDPHGKFPDVIIYDQPKNWLLLIEAVTSHGPVDPKRQRELDELFGSGTAGLVFVTTFLARKDLAKYLGEISWETEVWVSESPGHMIHFDGKRFLGPYDS